jgi:hypothetical protein
LLESASGVETISEIGVMVGVSEKAKGASEGFAVNGSIADCSSEIAKEEEIMPWESGRAWGPERLIKWEGAAMEKIERMTEDLEKWDRTGSKVLKSS